MEIGIIGAGNMGSAILKGIRDKGLFEKIRVYDTDNEKAGEYYADMETVAGSDVIVLAVKPNVLYLLIDQIRDFVPEGTIVVSVAAGQSAEKIEKAFAKKVKVVRVMPNTPLMVGEGMTAIAPSFSAEDSDLAIVKSIFESAGRAEIVPESLMDAVTGVSGSSPAYVYMFIEALADAAVNAGLPRDKSYTFAAQSVLGAAKMVLETGKHPGELKDNVCSPGGTTIEAVKVLEEKGLRGTVMEAVSACVEKSKKM
ncbi:MAG: pyrroline-5-carboxylate reductase [Clostridia bacterium]|nr:pyrroline-5-carboxylate reductase [Clostridia bacterium]